MRAGDFVRGHFRSFAASVGASSFNIHGGITAIGGRRCLIRITSRRKLHTGKKKSIVLLCMFVRFVNRNVAFSAKNCPILLTEYKRAPFLKTKIKISNREIIPTPKTDQKRTKEIRYFQERYKRTQRFSATLLIRFYKNLKIQSINI